MSTRKKGRPAVDPALKRQRINLTLSQEIIIQAEEYRTNNNIASLSELVEISLKAQLARTESPAVATYPRKQLKPLPSPSAEQEAK